MPPVKTSWNAIDRSPILGEYNDCTVIALHHALDIPYEAAHGFVRQAGRRKRKGFNTHTLWAYMTEKGITTNYRLHYNHNTHYITAAKFIKRWPRGTFYVSTWDHAFAIIDGVIQENKNCRSVPGAANARSRIRESWEVV